ncbi:interleukin-1 receptor type 1 isoform X2 [Tamandua tetradactyla]
MKQDTRIHQHNNKIWFVPAKVKDSGHYYCVVRNSTYCLRIKITAKVVENEPNLCYSAQATFPQKLPVAEDGRIVCPFMNFFKNENNEFPPIQWYKDCKPLLGNINFIGVENKLVLRNVSEESKGYYTCRASYTHLGKQYHVTRVIELTTIEENKSVRPVIVRPVNETMEVELGSQAQLICNVTGLVSDAVYWKWNGSDIDEDDPLLVEDFKTMDIPSTKKWKSIILMLNISEVESRFYLYPFTCLAMNIAGENAAYIQLIHPAARDFQKHMIGLFVMFTVVITCSVFIYKIFKVDIVLWYRDFCYDSLSRKVPDGKTYDAYILYPKIFGGESASNSDVFVFEVLPEVLERQCGYKLFILGRDDYAGEDIVLVTDENVKKSRTLMIILVREMLGFSSLGSSSEEQIAIYNALVQDGIKVVLLELEKIQDYEKMPESIKFIKQKHGAIRWSGNFTGELQSAKTRFWKNVRYHMPAQRQPISSKHKLLSAATGPNSKERLQGEVHLPLG